MVHSFGRLWAGVLLLASLQLYAEGVNSNETDAAANEFLKDATESKRSDVCLLGGEPGPNLSPIECRPLIACDKEALHQRYHAIYEQCNLNASSRSDVRNSFLNRTKQWHGDHKFLFNQLEQARKDHEMVLDVEQQHQTESELRRKLFIYSIEAGRTEDALLLHLTLPDQWTAKQLVSAIGSNANVNEVVMLHLLEFVRGLPSPKQRAELYREIKGLLEKRKLLSSYVTLMYGADAATVLSKEETPSYIDKIVHRMVNHLRQKLRWVAFDENMWISDNFPQYYGYHLDAITNLSRSEWNTIIKARFFEFSSLLEPIELRFQFLEICMTYVETYEKDHHERLQFLLVVLAQEVEKLRIRLEEKGRTKGPDGQRLQILIDRFQFGHTYTFMYPTYLRQYSKYGKYGSQYMELEQKG